MSSNFADCKGLVQSFQPVLRSRRELMTDESDKPGCRDRLHDGAVINFQQIVDLVPDGSLPVS
jgi:hypothetical protein